MSNLRRDVHSAFEVLTPPLGGMPERVVQTVLAEKHGRLRKEKMVYRLRVSLALVAAVLVAAVAVAGLMEWNSLRYNLSPAGQVGPTALEQLESRPLAIKLPNSLADCKSGPYDTKGNFGSGPIYGGGGIATSSQWGTYFHNYAYSDASIQGPILVRAKDLFGDINIVFVGPGASGPVVGTDVVDGRAYQQRTELVLSTGQASPGSVMDVPHKYVWNWLFGIPKNSPSSTGWQVDGEGFTEVFYVC